MAIDNLEPSNPQYTREGMHFLTVYSTALTNRGCVSVYIPEEHLETPDLPLVILLHGVYGSAFAWPFMGGAHRVAQSLFELGMIQPMGIVMPSDGLWGRGSGYINLPGCGCEDWIVEDVPEAMIKGFPCFTKNSAKFIAGYSMGGFGALRLGMKYPDKFKGIGGHSSAMKFNPIRPEWNLPPEKIAGIELGEEDTSVYYWARKNTSLLPPIRFDCGLDDFLLDQNEELHALLEDLKVDHLYEKFSGTHTYEYWNEHLARTLEFFNGKL